MSDSDSEHSDIHINVPERPVPRYYWYPYASPSTPIIGAPNQPPSTPIIGTPAQPSLIPILGTHVQSLLRSCASVVRIARSASYRRSQPYMIRSDIDATHR
ncbi:hypothetical protein DFJ43DRAFT_1156478 [Lentinula guzmanii]|uniref:Uncharacterized protein n=1 Tax=Lentinula guzmanii TaxID=2804957 RepID=A0AA38JK56_9AGAR|nr:hypothetical protein DFJ43DRAFT_1156478 [Lentinula guzmanii]